MKKVILIMLIVSVLIPMSAVAAASIQLDNYHWIHSNKIGTKQYLKNKSGASAIYGDAAQNDAVIENIQFDWEGLTGETLYLVYPDGSTQYVSSKAVTLNKATKSIQIALDKKTVNETWVVVSSLNVHDASDGGTDITYYYTSNTPTRYGDLGKGTNPGTGGGNNGGGGTGGTTPTNPPKDLGGRVDSAGEYLIWNATPYGTAKLTVTVDGVVNNLAPGMAYFKLLAGTKSYAVRAYDAKGNVIAKTYVTATLGSKDSSPGTEPDPDPGTGGGDNGGDNGGTDPGTGGGCVCPELCEELPKILKGVRADLAELNDAMQPLHGDLQAISNGINVTNSELRQIDANTAPLHGDLQEITRQITPTHGYNVPQPIKQPEWFNPGEVTRSEKNDETYFTDPGEAAKPGPLPAAPDPKPWVDLDGKTLNSQPELKPDAEIKPQQELKPDAEIKPQEELKPDAEIKPDSILQPEKPLVQDTPLQAEHKEYELRWRSSQYP